MDLQVDEFGAGDALLLIHGLGGTGNIWGGQVGLLARYFRVIVPDLRGAGRTGGVADISVASLVSDLIELLDRLKITRAHIVGHSFGSVVAQHLAVEHAPRVASLALIGPIRAPSDAAIKALTERAAVARKDGLTGIANATVQVGTSAATKAHRPEIAAFVREMVMRQNPAGYAATCEAVANIVPAALEKVRCPCLVVTGDEDATSPPAVARAVAEAVHAAQFRILPRCGHWIPLEQAEALGEALMNFLFAKP